jgi:hypothetical protein
MLRPDHHDEIELNLLPSGWVTYLLGGRKVRVEAGQLSVFWGAIPHQIIEFGSDTPYFVATIPFAWFLQCKLPEKFVRPILHGVAVCESTPARASADRSLFAQWVADLKRPTNETTNFVMLEMHARLLRLAATLPALAAPIGEVRNRRIARQDGGLNKVEQMACLIARQYADPLTIDDIGKAVGLHPNYAMNLFKKSFGTTLLDYLTHHRISHAQRLLATTDRKIVNVAFDSGFNSLSRFNETFRRACSCTPREYRLQHAVSVGV